MIDDYEIQNCHSLPPASKFDIDIWELDRVINGLLILYFSVSSRPDDADMV